MYKPPCKWSPTGNDIYDYVDLEVDGIDHHDYPDYVDAFIVEAYVKDKNDEYVLANDAELDWINEHTDVVYQRVMDAIH